MFEKFYWVQKGYSSAWKPENREGSRMLLLAKELILYGGCSNGILQDISVLETVLWKWR